MAINNSTQTVLTKRGCTGSCKESLSQFMHARSADVQRLRCMTSSKFNQSRGLGHRMIDGLNLDLFPWPAEIASVIPIKDSLESSVGHRCVYLNPCVAFSARKHQA